MPEVIDPAAPPTTSSSTGVTGGASGGQSSLDQVLGAVAALAASVQTFVNESGATQAWQKQAISRHH